MAEQLAANRTRTSADELIYALREVWTEMLGEVPGVDSLAVLASHWALETGRGKSMVAFNVGNFKSVEGDGRDYTFFTTWELVNPTLALSICANSTAEKPCRVLGPGDHGLTRVEFSPGHPACRFRAYKTLEDGTKDYLRSLKNRFKDSWPAVRMGDPKMFALLLKRQGYYTASLESYTAAMVGLFKEMQQAAIRVNADADTNPEIIAGEVSAREFTEEDMPVFMLDEHDSVRPPPDDSA